MKAKSSLRDSRRPSRGSSITISTVLDEVAIGDADVNAMQMAIDDRAFKLLALHQPVAIDLRMIVAAIKINADLERIGDLAVNIAEAARRYFVGGHGGGAAAAPTYERDCGSDARRCAEGVHHQQPRAQRRPCSNETTRSIRYATRSIGGWSISCGRRRTP